MADKNTLNVRQSWEQAKKDGKLTGCGLIDDLTMDDIDEIKLKIEEALQLWPRLAGLKPIMKMSNDEMVEQIASLEKQVNKLHTENAFLESQVSKLQLAKTDLANSIFDKSMEKIYDSSISEAEENIWIELTK